MRVFGARRVNEYLLSVVETGTSIRIAGALQARYWAQMTLVYPSSSLGLSYERATLESRAAYEALHDVWRRWADLTLEKFVANTDVDVRRCAIWYLCLDPNQYDSAHRDLVMQAIAIASAHPDEHIRRRAKNRLVSDERFYHSAIGSMTPIRP
jgi:hypothetical protein